MLAQFCAMLLFLWTPVSARILALVLQLYERNKLKPKDFNIRYSVCFCHFSFTITHTACVHATTFPSSLDFAEKKQFDAVTHRRTMSRAVP